MVKNISIFVSRGQLLERIIIATIYKMKERENKYQAKIRRTGYSAKTKLFRSLKEARGWEGVKNVIGCYSKSRVPCCSNN